jgi:hypothetical protein
MRLSNLIRDKLCFLGFALWSILGCSPPSPSDITGTYTRLAPGFRETLIIKQDGTFQQTVNYSNETPVELRDTWTNEYKQISFHRLYVTFDIETGRMIKPPGLVYLAKLEVGKGILIVNADRADRIYAFRRQSDPKK